MIKVNYIKVNDTSLKNNKHSTKHCNRPELEIFEGFKKILLEKQKILLGRLEMVKDIVADEKLSYWKMHAEAKRLFSKPVCFICEHEVEWQLDAPRTEYSGRMFNFTESKLLVAEHWITICRSCLKRKVLKEILEEGLGGGE